MSLDDIIARAAPPPERCDPAVFEQSVRTPDDDVLGRRRHKLVQAFGSYMALAAHAEALGLAPEEWVGRFAPVRLAGADPDWAQALRAIFERLSDGPKPFASVRRWAKSNAEAACPKDLPRASDLMEGPLDYLANRIGILIEQVHHVEGRLDARPGWALRLHRNPALAYALGRVTADWIDDLARILRSAAADRALLSRSFFGGDDLGALLRIECGLGDSHAGGRSVAILRFERGPVVYKPKDLRVAMTIAEIVHRIDEPGLVPPSVLIRDGYAWEPVHEAHPISDESDADRFFEALGGWLALVQGLGGNDFWFDNLIADGPVPRFIDFETTVLPPLDWTNGRFIGGEASVLADLLPTSVGILPMLYPTGDGLDATDISCMTRPGMHRTPLRDLRGDLLPWHEDRFAPRYADGVPADAAAHFDAFEEGYLRILRVITSPPVRERIVETLQRASDAPVRIIAIDSWFSYQAIRRSLMPCHLSDGAWREIALHAELRGHTEVVGEIREAAVRDLRRIDIPLFQARLGSRDLLGVEGERRPDAFRFDAISAARERLRMLGGRDEAECGAWLRSGFAVRYGNPPRRRPGQERLPPAAAPGDLLAWADEIAKALVRSAVSDGRGQPTWCGRLQDVFTGWRALGPLGFDILSGRAGVALALLELARALRRSDLADLARETSSGAAKDFLRYPSLFLRFGAGYVVGAGGLVATLAREPQLRSFALDMYRLAVDREIWMRSGGDFVSGLAGWCEGALALGEPAPSQHGTGRPYAPGAHARLAQWLAPESAIPLCANRREAARLRRDRDRHGSWFAAQWLDDRHNLSGIDGLPALAVRFVRLAREDIRVRPQTEVSAAPAGPS